MTPRCGDRYLSFPELDALCEALAAAQPGWVRCLTVGHSREGRPIRLLVLGRNDGDQDLRPGFWLDGGTHAAEWTGVIAALYAACRWVEGIGSEPRTAAWFERHTVYVLPCMSPDGYQAMFQGEPYLRSVMRPPREGDVRSGMDPGDIDGDGVTRWMRWRDPAGTHVPDAEVPGFMRPRRIEDDPSEAYFVATEGRFVAWDGQRWTEAPLRYGHDLNRNFPAHWAPFSMFGMDSGAFALSEPESRAVVDAFAARPRIGAALTNHTWTGALLTQPYRADSPLEGADIELMEALGAQAVEGTGYRVMRVHPDFTYDASQPIVGVWADSIATVFGVPGYTLELWDPYAAAGAEIQDPAKFFRKPDPAVNRVLIRHFARVPGAMAPWRPFQHPQLGPVEIGGLDVQRTVRNPPENLLMAECERGYQVAERLRLALPRVEARATVREGLVELTLENLGALPTSALRRGEKIGAAPAVSASIELGEGLSLLAGASEQALGHLDGWGNALGPFVNSPLYPHLPARGHRATARWWVRGQGELRLRWSGGRGGAGELVVQVA